MKKVLWVVFLAVMVLMCGIMTACLTNNALSGLVTVLGNATSSIASIEGNTGLATQIKADTAAASAAVLAWKSGTPAQDAIEALNIVEDDLNLIPMTGPYVALVDLGIGTIESILAMLPSSTASQLHESKGTRRQVAPVHVGKWKNPESEFKDRWNAIVAKDSALASVAIK